MEAKYAVELYEKQSGRVEGRTDRNCVGMSHQQAEEAAALLVFDRTQYAVRIVEVKPPGAGEKMVELAKTYNRARQAANLFDQERRSRKNLTASRLTMDTIKSKHLNRDANDAQVELFGAIQDCGV